MFTEHEVPDELGGGFLSDDAKKLIEYHQDGVLSDAGVKKIVSNSMSFVTPDGEIISSSDVEDSTLGGVELLKQIELRAKELGITPAEFVRNAFAELFANGGFIVLTK